jgi:hypothetical protein
VTQPYREPDGLIEIASGVSAFTGEGFVTLRWAAESAQFTPDEARQHALSILECAEAAESDAAVFAWARSELDVDGPSAARFIGTLRNHRNNPVGGI